MAENGDTRTRLKDSSIVLFSKKWYSSVSIVEICKNAGLSNGVFYRYWKNKEELFLEILENVISSIEEALDHIKGNGTKDKFADMTDIVFRFSWEHPDLITIFREGQYRYIEYERRLSSMYRRILSKILGHEASIAEYLVAIGGMRYAAIRRALYGQDISLRPLLSLAAKGLFTELSMDKDKVFGITVSPPAIKLSASSRERLLNIGKKLFAEKGYNEVNIHEITDAAKLSVGAFYTYFDSKESFFKEQVITVGREIRHFISSHLGKELNRLEREIQGLFLFSVYISLDNWCYDLVRECEFVAPETALAYYEAFKKGYLKMGKDGIRAELLEENPAALGSIAEYLMGISHYFGLEVAFRESPGNARAVAEELAVLLSRGLFNSSQKEQLYEKN